MRSGIPQCWAMVWICRSVEFKRKTPYSTRFRFTYSVREVPVSFLKTEDR